ncbi:hypothetical protein QBC34DRAFT_131662 [Podospora aff. communis PSN243]|uniref:Cytoskeleton-associated protein n=1 Tax=Podospora aff. communis PSN243 TaxID=3040156 RepID=A0AAV9GHY1_9PEZI|nr:hypothetical protein QBC34DRAFT_131662 [Podospora aff. communis PSN243]
MGWFGSFIRSDPVIFGAMGASAATLIFVMRFVLEQWREDAEIKPVQPKTQYITQDTEDSLKAETLSTLLGHYNYAIRETSAKIVCDRAVNDGSTIELLLWGITRPDYDERMKNLRALAVITDTQSLHALHTWKAYAALVRSLELSLDPNQEKLDDENWDECPLRDVTEKLCLMFICQLIGRYDAEKLIKAKFVEKWLAKQNWGSTEQERQLNFYQYVSQKNNRICEIISCIQKSPAGREALIKAGLMAKSATDQGGEDESRMIADRFNILISMDMGDPEGRIVARTITTDFDEHRRRQLHREAMVLNEDIIQRDHGSPP